MHLGRAGRGGENIYPCDLNRHLALADARVVDERYGEEPVARIRPHPGHSADAEALRAFCRQHIAHVTCVEDFPMTVTGKVQKFRMREISIATLRIG